MSTKKGRPKLDNPKNERIYIRVAKDEKKEIMDFSGKSGYTILDLIKIGIEKVKGKKK